MLAALARLRFQRLQRLSVTASSVALTLGGLEALGKAGAAWLARLARLELQAPDRVGDAVRAAALDPDGPLRALHRGGGELAFNSRR